MSHKYPQIVLLSYIMNVSTHTMYILSNATKHLSQLPWSKPPTSPLLGSQSTVSAASRPPFSTKQKTCSRVGSMGKMVADSQHFHVFCEVKWLNPPKKTTGHLDGGCVVWVCFPWPLHLGGILQHDFQPRWQQTWHTKIYQHDDNSNMWLRYRYCILPIWVNIFQ